MRALLAFAHGVDWINDRFAWIAEWAVFLSCFISAANALVRYLLHYSSNGFLEIQWYLFAACVMLGASQVLRVNEHVRVDIVYSRLGGRAKVLVDLFGLVLFLVPVMVAMIWFSWPVFTRMYESGEVSNNVGGLIRWPAMFMLPLGFAMVLLQGLSEIVKRVGWLANRYQMDTHYERPLQ
jgi:TRAP-type mannitol/chloroaromatic compound transport system permease small subunit